MWKIFRPTDYKHTITTQAIQLIIVSTTNNNCAHVLIARLALLKVELWLVEGYRCPIREQKWPDFTTFVLAMLMLTRKGQGPKIQ